MNVSTKLAATGIGAAVGATLWAATGQRKHAPDANSAFINAAITTAASVGAFALMAGGRDRLAGPNAATFAMMGMGLGAAASYAITGVRHLAVADPT